LARISRGSIRAPRRRKGWEEGPGGVALTTVAATGSAFLGTVANPAQDGLTLIRTRGRFAAFIGNATSVGDGYQGAFAIGITQAAATAVGITAVPTPITEQDWDGWIFWQAFGVHSQVDKTVSLAPGAAGAIDFEVDSKAMRKLDLLDSIYAVVEITEIGTATMNMFFDSRLLLALP